MFDCVASAEHENEFRTLFEIKTFAASRRVNHTPVTTTFKKTKMMFVELLKATFGATNSKAKIRKLLKRAGKNRKEIVFFYHHRLP